jgi:hypothetical protein
MGEQDVIDGRRIEAKRRGVVFAEFMSALMQPAVDQYALAGAFQQMAGTGDAAVGAVKGNFQAILLMFIVELRNMLGEYPAQRPHRRQRPMPGIKAAHHEVHPSSAYPWPAATAL